MIQIGRTQELLVLRRTKAGLILGDEDDLEVLLPASETVDVVPDESTLRVFVYPDEHDRLLATLRPPRAEVGRFAKLQVDYVDHRGAHMHWGLEPGLLVPHREQQKELFEGRWYVVHVALDERAGRIYGSTRIEAFLDNTELTVDRGDKVELLVYRTSDLGLSVIVNDRHQGLVHANEIFKHVSLGDRITGHVKQIREDGKLDITLQPPGYRQYNDANVDLLAKRLKAGGGFLPLSDKSPADVIYDEFGISKKAFKQALGALYKQRRVRIDPEGITLIR